MMLCITISLASLLVLLHHDDVCIVFESNCLLAFHKIRDYLTNFKHINSTNDISECKYQVSMLSHCIEFLICII